MIVRIVSFAASRRLVTIALTLVLTVLGWIAFRQLKIEAYPDISETQVIVVTKFAGHAAEEMEQQITVPVERALNSIPHVIARRSRTIFGLSVVEITFEYGTDDYFARQVVLEKLRQAAVPAGAETELAPPATPAGELFRYVLVGPGREETDLRELQDWVIAPRLLQESGVADVPAFGGQVKQYQIEISPLALEKYNLRISEIARAIGANNRNAGGALIDNRQQSLVVRGVGLIRSVADIESVVLNAPGGVPVYVRDVGRVRIGPALQTGIFGLDGETGGVEGLVLMRRGENPSEVLRGVRRAVEDLNADGLPEGVRIVPIYDRTVLVDGTLRTVSRTLLEALGIVSLVLLFFLGSVRAALLTALVVPLSLLFAFLAMYLYGIPASLLSLGAIDFGIIVDGTLVMVEFIVRRMAEDTSPRPSVERVRDAALAISRPLVFSASILVCAYLPLFLLERVERRLFTPMAFTICAALAGSLLFSLTLVPAVASILFRGKVTERSNPVFRWLTQRYRRDLAWSLDRPWRVVAASALLLAAGAGVGRFLGSEFLPQLDEGVIWVRAVLPPGTSLTKSSDVATDIRTLIRQSPEVLRVASQTGRVDSGTDPFGPNRIELLVTLRPYDEWAAGRVKRDLVEELAARLRDQIPGADFNFTQPIIDMVTESVTGSSADLAVIISGPDLERLRRLGAKTLELVRTLPGAADTAIEQEAEQSQLRIELNRQALARHALNVEDVQDLIEMAIGGRAVSTKFEGERQFDIAVRYAPEARADGVAIGNILVHAPDGARIPLWQLADIGVADGASIVARRDNRRQITVRTNIRGRDQGSFVEQAQGAFRSRIELPPGYQVNWGGQFENLDRARRRLVVILPITVAIIFSLLFWTFGSVSSAGLVLLNVPFSIVGGVMGLWLRGIHLSVSAAVGFVSLFGVAVMAGVLSLGEIERRRERGMPLKEAVLTGATAQLRPMLMLVVVALLGMLPAAMARGIGSDIQRPMATVVVGGLVSTLLFNMALPVLYLLVERAKPEPAPDVVY